jgi:hypothetical protein
VFQPHGALVGDDQAEMAPFEVKIQRQQPRNDRRQPAESHREQCGGHERRQYDEPDGQKDRHPGAPGERPPVPPDVQKHGLVLALASKTGWKAGLPGFSGANALSSLRPEGEGVGG